MKNIFIVCLLIVVSACKQGESLNIKSLRTGTFEIPGEESFDTTIFIRTDSLQIETYGDRTDSLSITWKDNFNYTLKMLNPKTALDKEPIRVKITGIKGNSYDFEAIIGYSNYIQKGTVTKIKE